MWKNSHGMCREKKGLDPVVTDADTAYRLLMTLRGTQSIQERFDDYNFIPVSCIHVCSFQALLLCIKEK